MAKKDKAKKGKGWTEIDPPQGGGARWDTAIEFFKFSDEYQQIRLLGDVYEVAIHWVPTLKKTGGTSSFPRLCLKNLDDNHDCPYCNAGLQRQTVYMSNAIIREIQDDQPRNVVKPKRGQEWKSPKDKVWTPIRVVQFPSTVAAKIIGFTDLNKVKDKKTGQVKTYPVSDIKNGRDLQVKKDTSIGAGGSMWDIQREDRVALDKTEQEYLLYNIEDIFDHVEELKDAIETISIQFRKGVFEDDDKYNSKDIAKVIGLKKSKKSKDDDDDDDYEDERPKKKSKKDSKKKSKVDYDEDDEDLDDDDEDLDEEYESKSKKKSKKSKKSKDDDDDDDLDDEDLDDLDDDEDDEPKSKKSKKGKAASKKKSKKSEDDDDDDDDEPKSKKSKKDSKKKSKKSDDDDDDEDLDDLDDDDDDEPKSKKKSNKDSKKKSKKSKK